VETEFKYLGPALQVLSGNDPQFKLVRKGQEAGWTILERYAAVPRLSDPRALVPLEASSAVWPKVLGLFAAGAASPLARAAARTLILSNKLGLTSLFLRDRISIATRNKDISETPLHGFLAGVVGRKDFVTSLRLAPGRPNSKPIVQAIGQDGEVLAYCKFGWEALTRKLVKREAQVLRELEPLCEGTAINVPTVRFSGDWHGLEVLVVAPLSGKGKTPRTVGEIPAGAIAALKTLRPASEARLVESAIWQRMREQAKKYGPGFSSYTRHVIDQASETVDRHWGDAKVSLGQSHGDWIPPNISVLPDGQVNVWDWERGDSAAPIGIDAMQFILFLEMRQRGTDLRSAESAAAKGRDALTQMGLNPVHAPMLLVLSLMRSILWFGEARHAGRGEDEDLSFTRMLESCLRLEGLPLTQRIPAVAGSGTTRHSGVSSVTTVHSNKTASLAPKPTAGATFKTGS